MKKAINMSADLNLSQLLSSRICHDLVGAAGAINAGIELICEDPGEIDAPLGLMAASAAQVTRRLSFFRIAFGFGVSLRFSIRFRFVCRFVLCFVFCFAVHFAFRFVVRFAARFAFRFAILVVCLFALRNPLPPQPQKPTITLA